MGFFKNMITAAGITLAGMGASNAETPKGTADLLKDDTKIEVPELKIKKANLVMPGEEETLEQIMATNEAENRKIREHNAAVRAAASARTEDIQNVRKEIARSGANDNSSEEESSDLAMKD